MKRYNPIHTLVAVLTAALLLAGCSEESLPADERPLPPAGTGELSLGELQLAGSDATTPTRAAATNPLPKGATLRLYAFQTGETDFSTKLASRTYTIDAQGKAILDLGQQPLYLPAGEVDIYLVGPVQHNTGTDIAPVLQEVASEGGIYPSVGSDLIADYVSTTIIPGQNNPLPQMVLEHKMALTQVVVMATDASVYENLNVKEIKIYDQPVGGTYTLDNTGGTIIPGDVKKTAIPEIKEEESKMKYSGTIVLIPQSSKELKIETTFECNQKNVDPDDNHPTLKYRQSGLVTSPLIGGTATRFTTTPITPVEIKWRTKVLPWNDVLGEEIVIPGLGIDIPYVEINGIKWATGNLIAFNNHKCMVGAPTDYGLYFQHGSLIGWAAGETGDGRGQGQPALAVKVKPDLYIGSDEWANVGYMNSDVAATYDAATGQGDPCRYYLGAPWRLPTAAEFSTLFSNVALGTSWQNCATGAWTSVPIVGAWAGSGAKTADAKKSIFFSASGIRYFSSGGFWGMNTHVFAWSSNYRRALMLSEGSIGTAANENNRGGMPIRCVSK